MKTKVIFRKFPKRGVAPHRLQTGHPPQIHERGFGRTKGAIEAMKPELLGIDLSKLTRDDQQQVRDLEECARKLYGVVADVMPQIGGIVVQDYESLNRGLILAEQLFGRKKR